VSAPHPADLFSDQTSLLQLAARLRQLGVVPFTLDAGTVRTAILDAGLQCVVCGGSPKHKAATFAERYAEVFGEPLGPAVRRPRGQPNV
jgi:hypothetical protein